MFPKFEPLSIMENILAPYTVRILPQVKKLNYCKSKMADAAVGKQQGEHTIKPVNYPNYGWESYLSQYLEL